MLPFDFTLHIFQGDSFGFGEDAPDHSDLDNHHHREEREWRPSVWLAGIPGEDRKGPGDNHGHEPMCGTAQRLSLGANGIREDLADIDPDDGTLPERVADDVTDEQPEKHTVMGGTAENPGYAGERYTGANGTPNQ